MDRADVAKEILIYAARLLQRGLAFATNRFVGAVIDEEHRFNFNDLLGSIEEAAMHNSTFEIGSSILLDTKPANWYKEV